MNPPKLELSAKNDADERCLTTPPVRGVASSATTPFATFLAVTETVLEGQIGPTGVVLSANLPFQRWLSPSNPSHLEAALTPKAQGRWRDALRRIEMPGQTHTVMLRFAPEPSRTARFRCVVARSDDNTYWLVGEKVAAHHDGDSEAVRVLRSELKQARRKARRVARTDALTGLPNRRQADVWLVQFTDRAERRGEPLGCLMVDIDRFKEVNDTLGHPVGDIVLKEAAHTLAQGLRATDRLARFGGEEFLILLPETSGRATLAVAERLRVLLATRPVLPLQRPLTASFGIALLRPGESSEILLNRADAAMLRAKRSGRDRVVVDE